MYIYKYIYYTRFAVHHQPIRDSLLVGWFADLLAGWLPGWLAGLLA